MPAAGGLPAGLELKRLWVRNFKSLRDFSLEVLTRFNVVVGANGSGKTALAEVFELWRDLLDYARGRTVNPFLRWWGYDRVVWRHDESLNVVLGLEFGAAGAQEHFHAGYEVEVSGRGGHFRVIAERLSARKGNLQVFYDSTGRMRVEAKIDAAYLKGAVEMMLRKRLSLFLLERKVTRSLETLYVVDMLGPALWNFAKLLGKRGVKLFLEAISKFDLAEHIKLKNNAGRLELKFTPAYTLPPMDCYVEFKEREEHGDIVAKELYKDELLDELRKELRSKKLFGSLTSSIANNISISEELKRAVYSIKEGELPVKALQRAVAELLVRRLIEDAVDLVVDTAFSILSFVDRIVLLKDIDTKAVRSPQRLERQERLLPDASNFVPFLFTLTGGKAPRELEEAVRYAFPGVGECRLGLDATTDGRVFIKLVVDGVTLPPATIPAGVLKTLIIETALYSKPSVIVIDEFENSLHPELQQFLIDELRGSGAYVFIMSHSTVPLDYVKSPREVVVLRLEGGETKAYRLREEARERMQKYGLTLSELLLSGLLEPAG